MRDSEPVDAFERDGYVVLDGLLDERHTATLRRAVQRVWDEQAAGGQAPSHLHLFGFLGRDAEFLSLLTHPVVLALVRRLLGTNVYLYHSHLDVHPTEQPGWYPYDWHRDGGTIIDDIVDQPGPLLAVKAAYFLTDVPTARHGALHIVPGSHRDPTPPSDPATIRRLAVPVTVRAGTAVLFDRRVVHARGANESTATRTALFYGFAHRWIRPRDTVELDAEAEAHLSPLYRQLLGRGETLREFHVPGDAHLPLASWQPPASALP